jgi:hypothetical protein
MRSKASVCHSGKDKVIAQRIATDLIKEGIDICEGDRCLTLLLFSVEESGKASLL